MASIHRQSNLGCQNRCKQNIDMAKKRLPQQKIFEIAGLDVEAIGSKSLIGF